MTREITIYLQSFDFIRKSVKMKNKKTGKNPMKSKKSGTKKSGLYIGHDRRLSFGQITGIAIIRPSRLTLMHIGFFLLI